MNLLTAQQRAEANNSLGFTTPADADDVLRTITAIRYADRHRADPLAVSRALSGALDVIRRLLDVEENHTATRSTVARLVIANNRGDDYSLSDLAFELEQAGVDLKDDYDVADDLARATEQEPLL
ncbi:hypothetical protein [Streptomyces spinosirectus]